MVFDPPHVRATSINAHSWMQAGRVCGVNVTEVFESLGIQCQTDALQRLRVPPTWVLSAVQRCTERSVGEHFPLALGESLAAEHGPSVDAYLATSPTAREALNLLGPAAHHVNAWLTVRLEEADDEAWISCDLPPELAMMPPSGHVIEAALCALRHLGLPLLGPDATLRAVHFRHAAPHRSEPHLRHFGVAPRFGQLRNAMFFDRASLDRRLPGGSARLHQAAVRLLTTPFTRNAQAMPVAAQVERHLRCDPHLLQGGLCMLAMHMGLTPRSLQRRLTREGRVFSDLLDAVRCDLATRWLTQATRDIHSVSERLGYRDRRAFTSAFKRWTGQTPTQYRQQAQRPDRPLQ